MAPRSVASSALPASVDLRRRSSKVVDGNGFSAFAELDRERTSERTREKIDMRRRAGLWFGGVPPLGYKSHPTDKTTIQIAASVMNILATRPIPHAVIGATA